MFSWTLHCFGIFWKLGCMPLKFAGLIKRGCLMLWPLTKKNDQKNNFDIACMF
jgi:hypothetical protein